VIPAVRSRSLKLLLTRAKPEARKTIGELVGDEAVVREGQTALVKHNPSSAIALATWLRNPPDMAEAFSGAMNSLLFASGAGLSTKVIVVTSPEPGDGKTTVATNLAISLAQIGRRVVVVDGDLRKPRLHDIFGKEVKSGLADILDDTTAIDEAVLAEAIFETQVKNLYVLPTTSAKEGISAKLHSGRMRTLLERLRREFEVIIIDSPPMLNVSDARVLGWLSDGVLLVLRARRTTRDAALAARECLLQDGISVVGTILNDWYATRDSKYGSYGSYGHPRYQ
jgi:capsular exopolysaccharide synthesis family protein